MGDREERRQGRRKRGRRALTFCLVNPSYQLLVLKSEMLPVSLEYVPFLSLSDLEGIIVCFPTNMIQ